MSTELKSAPPPAFESNARAIIDAARELHAHEVLTVESPDGVEGSFAVLPVGKTIVSLQEQLEAWRERPKHASGTVVLTDEPSFVAHVIRSADAASLIFADDKRTAPRLTAIFDYHEPAGGSPSDDGAVLYPTAHLGAGSSVTPRWGRHRASYAPALSDEWQAWHKADGQWLAPVELAEFLENHLVDVYSGEPSTATAELLATIDGRLASASQLLLLSRNFEVNVDSTVRHAQKLSSGEIAITYNETHRDGAGEPIKVPTAFLIAIPVFRKGPAYQLLVRLRYRMQSGQLRWSMLLHRSELAFDHAMRELCERVTGATGLPLHFGFPE